MNLKKIISGVAKDKLAEQVTRKIVPLEEAAPTKGWKAKAAAILAGIAVIAGTLSQFLGGS
jgi:hypothetical protein